MSQRLRIIIILVISIIILVLLGIIVYNVVYLPSVEGDKQHNNNVEHLVIDYKPLEICREDVDCGYGMREYDSVESDISTEALDEILNSINTKINDYYNRSLNSTDMSSPECSLVSDIYMRSIMTQSRLITYDSDDLLAFSLVSGESNLCLNTNNEEVDVYYYDVKSETALTEDDIKEKYSITDDEIMSAIEENINQMNTDANSNYTVDDVIDYKLYIDNSGSIGIYYKIAQDTIYYSVILDKTV